VLSRYRIEDHYEGRTSFGVVEDLRFIGLCAKPR
jgi:hypothetical protein